MTLSKAIKHGKEHREEPKSSKKVDRTDKWGRTLPITGVQRIRNVTKMKLDEVEKLIEEDEISTEDDPVTRVGRWG